MRSHNAGAFVDAWANAEHRGDVSLLDSLLDADFVAVTDDKQPLSKQEWLARYRSGCLVHHAFCWRTIDARVGTGHAFVVGCVEHASSYGGQGASGRQTVTLTLTLRERQRWQLTGLHASITIV